MKGFLKQKKGITLIALVITIVVLLILAGVTIATLMGDNGILTKASDAEVEQSHATVREALELAYNEWKIQINTSSNTKLASTETIVIQGKKENAESETTTTFFDFLVSKLYVDESTRIIDVEKLTGSKQTLGNGTGSTDVYKLDEDEDNYKLVYYGESEEDITDITTIAKTEKGPFFYTQEDIDKTLDIFTYDTVIVTEENREEYGYSEDMVGKTVTIITGTKERYYVEGKGGTFPLKKIVIPRTINGSDYVDIKCGSFRYLDNLETIIYLNDLGVFGFIFCSDVKYVKLTQNNEIGDYSGTVNLSIIEISDDVTAMESGYFESCRKIQTVNIPDSVTSIKNNAFENCTTLTSISIPSSVTFIGRNAFENCPNLTITVETGSPLTIDDFSETGIDPSKVIFK